MPKSKSSEQVLCSCGCNTRVSRRTRTRHLQGNGPTLALAEMFETRNYFGTTHASNFGDGHTRPSKRRRIMTMDPGPPLMTTDPGPPLVTTDPGPSLVITDPGLSLVHPAPQSTPSLDVPPPLDTPTINPDEILASRWMGRDDIGDLDDDIEFEGHSIPQLAEVSDDEDEDSELDSEDQWDDGVAEDLLEILQTNVELDASDAGM